MVAQKGRELLLKLSNMLSPEVFTTIAGLRDTSITINEQEVDVTSKEDSGIRQLLSGNILSSVSVSASGVFKNDAALKTVRDAAKSGTHKIFQIVIPGTSTAGGTYEGSFRITQFEHAGAHDGEAQFSLTLESDGTVAFTAAT